MADTKERGRRKVLLGYVVSDKMDKTIVVQIQRRVKHAVYKKYVNRRMTYKAHDENNTCAIGDKVRIIETRPLSKDKRWRLLEVVEKSVQI